MADPWYEGQPDAARGSARIKQLMAGPGNREVVHKLVRWTVIMFTAPFIAYFGLHESPGFRADLGRYRSDRSGADRHIWVCVRGVHGRLGN